MSLRIRRACSFRKSFGFLKLTFEFIVTELRRRAAVRAPGLRSRQVSQPSVHRKVLQNLNRHSAQAIQTRYAGCAV